MPGLKCDLRWNLLHISSNVNCKETTSGVWSGCVYHTLEVGQFSMRACVCVHWWPRQIKRIFFYTLVWWLHFEVALFIKTMTVDPDRTLLSEVSSRWLTVLYVNFLFFCFLKPKTNKNCMDLKLFCTVSNLDQKKIQDPHLSWQTSLWLLHDNNLRAEPVQHPIARCKHLPTKQRFIVPVGVHV